MKYRYEGIYQSDKEQKESEDVYLRVVVDSLRFTCLRFVYKDGTPVEGGILLRVGREEDGKLYFLKVKNVTHKLPVMLDSESRVHVRDNDTPGE